jgi:hypothetical protein
VADGVKDLTAAKMKDCICAGTIHIFATNLPSTRDYRFQADFNQPPHMKRDLIFQTAFGIGHTVR